MEGPTPTVNECSFWHFDGRRHTFLANLELRLQTGAQNQRWASQYNIRENADHVQFRLRGSYHCIPPAVQNNAAVKKRRLEEVKNL